MYSYRTDSATPEAALPLACPQRLAAVHAWAAARRDARREPAGEASEPSLGARTRQDLDWSGRSLVAAGVFAAAFNGAPEMCRALAHALLTMYGGEAAETAAAPDGSMTLDWKPVRPDLATVQPTARWDRVTAALLEAAASGDDPLAAAADAIDGPTTRGNDE